MKHLIPSTPKTMASKQTKRQAESLLNGAGDGPFFCLCCQEECDLIVSDEGIGEYEYWGATGCDVQLVLSSSCCQDEWSETDPKEKDDIADPTDTLDLGADRIDSLDKTEILSVNKA